jgi:hypothetical protein
MRKTALALSPLLLGCSSGALPDSHGGMLDPNGGIVWPDLPPPTGGGVQLHGGPFQVPMGTEVEVCTGLRLGNDQALAVHGFREAHALGEYQAILYRSPEALPDETFPCQASDAPAAWEPLAVFWQQSGVAWTLPDGVAFVLAPHEQLVVDMHYVNATTVQAPAPAATVIDLDAMPLDAVVARAHGLTLAPPAAEVPPHQTITVDAACRFDEPLALFFVSGRFTALRLVEGTVDGVPRIGPVIVDGTPGGSWNAPAPSVLLRTFGDGGGLDLQCARRNDTDVAIEWGPHSGAFAPCWLYGWYYPLRSTAADGISPPYVTDPTDDRRARCL